MKSIIIGYLISLFITPGIEVQLGIFMRKDGNLFVMIGLLFIFICKLFSCFCDQQLCLKNCVLRTLINHINSCSYLYLSNTLNSFLMFLAHAPKKEKM